MESVFLVLPDFLIILLGALLAVSPWFPAGFWHSAEKLVFYVLFPPLLFTSVAGASVTPGEAGTFLAVAVGAMLFAVVLSYLLRFVVKTDNWTQASVFQCGFRFNTYIGFALCDRLFGENGFALLSLLIAVWVPISNAIAVSVLAKAVAEKENAAAGRPRTLVIKTVLKNPLIIATLLGLVVNCAGLKLPLPAETFLKHLGSASLAMGLLCIGAGLQWKAFKEELSLMAASCLQRLVAVPLVGWLTASVFGLGAVESGVLILFAALPTAQSCYVMTASMRGNAAAVANVTTAQTLVSMVTLSLWCALVLAPLAGKV